MKILLFISTLIMLLAINATAASGAGNWNIIGARWRPDSNQFARKQVWEGTFWSEGWSQLEQYYPKYFRPAGTVHVVLKNDNAKADTVSLVKINDKLLADITTTPERAGEVIWYRVESPQLPVPKDRPDDSGFEVQKDVPAGAWVECLVRFRNPQQGVVKLTCNSKANGDFDVMVDTSAVRTRVESISFSPSIDRAYLYVRSMDGKDAGTGPVKLDGVDVSKSSEWAQGPAGSGLAVIEVKLDPSWTYGSHHLIEIDFGGSEKLVQPVRAWDNYFTIGLYGEIKPEKVKAAKEHGINTYFGGPNEILDSHGMNTTPYWAAVDTKRRGPNNSGAVYMQNHDEPDVHDVRLGEALPFMDRLGVSAQREVLKIIRFQRKGAPQTPNMLLVDNTYKPGNWYAYGQTADIFCTDPYVPLNGRQVDYIWRALETARDASAPRPLVSVLWACSLQNSKRKFGQNAPTPEEERMMVFHALGCGIKGMAYFVDLTTTTGEGRFTGISDLPELWEEVTRINEDVSALIPYVSVGCPAGPPETQGDAWVRKLMCGRDKMLVIAVNTNHYIGFETKYEFVYHIPANNVDLSVGLPPHFKKVKIQEVKDGALVTAKGKVEGQNLLLSLKELNTAKAFLISAVD